ncbi:hypothetical protein BB561_002857 [Smittium simulii]|uniref:RRM domain-containing protein n=1 Tax=Smittium simulii TaxID=133385 RepID=A0A2T9YP12_9FUNG|nr:hypothetical protein BB561_002857 [Smittium simulii]
MSQALSPDNLSKEEPVSSDQDYLYSTTYNNENEPLKDEINVNHIDVPESWNLENDTETADFENHQSDSKPHEQNPELYNTKSSEQGSLQDNFSSHPNSDAINSKYIGKLFIGGLSWETNEDRLQSYFSKFGEVTECKIMRDQATNRPRGFGFVTFADSGAINKVLLEPTHFLDDKRIDPKPAVPRDQQNISSNNFDNNIGQQPGLIGLNQFQPTQTMEQRSDTLFAGGLPPTVIEDDLRKAFERFGAIVEVKMMVDRETGRPRGFAFVQFDNEMSVQNAIKVCESGDGLVIHDKRVDVKRAVHKKKNNQNDMMGAGLSNNSMYQYGYGANGVMPYGVGNMGMVPGVGYGQGMNVGLTSGMGMGMNPNMMSNYGYNMMNPAMMNNYAYMMNPSMMTSMDYQNIQSGYPNTNQSSMGATNSMQMYGYAGYDSNAAAISGTDHSASLFENQNEGASAANITNPPIGNPKDQEYQSADSQSNSKTNKTQNYNSGYDNDNYNRRSANEGSTERSRDRRDRRDISKEGSRRDRSAERDRSGRSYNRQQQGRSYGNSNYSR